MLSFRRDGHALDEEDYALLREAGVAVRPEAKRKRLQRLGGDAQPPAKRERTAEEMRAELFGEDDGEEEAQAPAREARREARPPLDDEDEEDELGCAARPPLVLKSATEARLALALLAPASPKKPL